MTARHTLFNAPGEPGAHTASTQRSTVRPVPLCTQRADPSAPPRCMKLRISAPCAVLPSHQQPSSLCEDVKHILVYVKTQPRSKLGDRRPLYSEEPLKLASGTVGKARPPGTLVRSCLRTFRCSPPPPTEPTSRGWAWEAVVGKGYGVSWKPCLASGMRSAECHFRSRKIQSPPSNERCTSPMRQRTPRRCSSSTWCV